MTGVSERSQQSCNLKGDGYIASNNKKYGSYELNSKRQQPLITVKSYFEALQIQFSIF
ncbi:conserved hypothetical protein [Xenorhabdus nematophila F1]|uniref:Uncharacterized protein n=1 Tax=Xenorhabdus nematophila (strain ATCC 19061 / DSM 3370 / CCUG 14189 / LMG 1036 / NCIMB 9965 / AN6) TaxID=406817 RepID=D3VI93_XENNA|nr:conserved hypothetical protein [Xenorhabdus nematophila ATCC 19061]CCW30190.1 conserved hypothetical protein [Xenorhabdus nematophila F1]CEK23570.1 conserved hypothetical protein [Xenorhabdus nematophila AN6/1]